MYREERLKGLIKKELGWIIERRLEIPNSLLTLTSVEINKHSGIAVIGFSVWPLTNSQKALKILKKNQNYFRFLLIKKINIKFLPKIEFVIDTGLANAAKIEKIIIEDKIKK